MTEYQFETVADRLKRIRLQRNISQDYLANKLGISQRAYSKIENNETRLNVEVLQRISEILDVSIDYFFHSTSQPVLNDFSNRNGGDNVMFKNDSSEKIEELYKRLLAAKDEIIDSKDNEINMLKSLNNSYIEMLKKM